MRVNLLDLTRIIIAANFCNTHLKINLFHQSGASSKPLCAKIKKKAYEQLSQVTFEMLIKLILHFTCVKGYLHSS